MIMNNLDTLQSILDGYYHDGADLETLAAQVSRLAAETRAPSLLAAAEGYYGNTLDAEEFIGLAASARRELTNPQPQEAPTMPTTPAPAEDTVTLRIPGRVAAFFQDRTPDAHASLDAMDRDIARALDTAEERRHGKTGTVTIMITTPAVAAGFLATLANLCEIEFDADDADTKTATAGLAYVQRCQAQGITTTIPDDYRMQDPAAQAALDADRAQAAQEAQQRAAQREENTTHRAAWESLTREERQERTTALLDAACTVLGLQRADRRNWLDMGSVAASVTDGRLYMEVRRLADPTAQPALDAARNALQAAGWTVTDWGTHFYAQAPQEPAQGPQEAREVLFTDHHRCEHRKTASADHAPTCPVYDEGATAERCTCHYSDALCEERQTTATPVTVEWTHTVRGHRNGTARIGSTTYRITHITHASRKRGALGDHLAHTPAADGRTGPYVARTWGLPDLLATLAQREGITGPLDVRETGRERLTRR
jgi:hypothetical protein